MSDHGSRAHALWSASATERNWNCSGALALTKDLPEKTGEAADWGTACHQLSEKCFRSGKGASDFIGTTEKGKVYSFEVDDEMADTAQFYVDYCNGRRKEYKDATGENAIVFIEEKFSLATLNPPFEAGGTGDFILYFPKWRMIEIVDLKGGRGVVVEVEENKQLRTYGLGAILRYPKFDVEKVKVTVVQPRAPHRDGRRRSEEFHIADLVEWTADLLERMHRSKKAMADKATMSDAAWAKEYLRAGNHCSKTFCKAQGFCPALEQKAFDDAGVWFDDLDQPRLTNMPDADDPEKLARDLDALDMIEDWIKARRARAHELAEQGVEIPNYILVPKQGREKWNEDAEDKAAKIAIDAGVAGDKVWNKPKIRTPKQVREALAKAKAIDALNKIKDLSSTPENGTNLVRASKTSRAAVAPAVHKHFDILD